VPPNLEPKVNDPDFTPQTTADKDGKETATEPHKKKDA
jgi:molecular chaperone HtpG